MKKVVVFGSGHVARPAIRALLESGHDLLVATDQPEVGRAMLDGHPHGRVIDVDATDLDSVHSRLEGADLAISLLPVSFHLRVATACLRRGIHFVTTSYVSDEMRALHLKAEAQGLTFLNEVGADPGIDHMQAMRIIDSVRDAGGRVTGVYSVCGGLPAPEANDNPLGYKISWSTRGVALAGRRPAQFLRDGQVVVAGPFEIFQSPRALHLDGLGDFESYPNGDSLRFVEEYGLRDLDRMFRGSLRFSGWCETWAALARLGYVEDLGTGARTYADLARELAGAAGGDSPRDATAAFLGLEPEHPLLDRLQWLGLFDEEEVGLETPTRLDLLVQRMDRRLRFEEGQRDMLILYTEVDYVDAGQAPHQIRSLMVEYGISHGDSAMARTVGLPAACAARRILDGSITRRGVCIPVHREIYDVVLTDLEGYGIREEIEES